MNTTQHLETIMKLPGLATIALVRGNVAIEMQTRHVIALEGEGVPFVGKTEIGRVPRTAAHFEMFIPDPEMNR